jgi:DNA-binding response OmpR family regulator
MTQGLAAGAGRQASTGVARSAGPAGRLAVLDTDSGFVRVLSKRLEANGWGVRTFPETPSPGRVAEMSLSAVLVDPSSLGPEGLGFLEAVLARAPELPVLVCSGPSSVAERVRALRLGAEDWVTKPCHPEEVVARLETITRRRRQTEARPVDALTTAGELEIRGDQFQAFVGGRSLDLTRREFEVLDLLARSEGRVLEREEIYQRVWGYTMVRGDRSVDVFVRKVRQKIEHASPGWRYIHTHFGIGYRFEPEPV